VSKMHTLEEQNQSLQSNYELIKEDLIETRKKYNEARENYMATAAAKLEAQRQSEAFIEKIKYQLSEKTKEFEQHRDKYTPQDIEYVRIQVQEDLEVSHRQKIQSMEADIEKQKQLYFNTRRELERVKTEFEALSQSRHKELHVQREEHEETVAALRRQVSELQLRDYTPDKDDKMRAQRARINELESSRKTLEDEVASLQRERDDALHSYDVARSRHEEAFVELRGKLALTEADKQALEHKVGSLTASLTAAENQVQSKRQSVEELERSLRHARQLLEERENTVKALRETGVDEVAKLEATLETERSELSSRIDSLESRLADREAIVRRYQRDTVDMQLRAESLITEQRRSHSQQILEARQRADALELEALELRESARATESHHSHTIDQHLAENDRLRSEVSRLQREKEILHTQLRDVEQKYTTEKQRIGDIRRAADEAQRLLKSKINTLESEIHTIEKKYVATREKLRSAEESREKLRIECERQVECVQQEGERRYEELGRTYRAKLEDMKNKVKKAVHKERKRGDAYKDHALTAHRKGKALSNAALAMATGDDVPLATTQF